MVFQFTQGGEDLFFAVQALVAEFGGAGGYLKNQLSIKWPSLAALVFR